MKMPRSQIVPVVAKLTQKAGTTKRLSREIAAYLLEENRVSELDSLLRDVIAYRSAEGIVEITAISAHELSDAMRRDIEKLVREQFPSVKQIVINQRIDKSTVGGVRLELVDRQLDLTVCSKLNRLKQVAAI